MKKHFVTFLSPGTFVPEQTTKEIESWDIAEAVRMSKSVEERYEATPYGFYFTTRERGPDDFDSKETQRSGTYFLGGKIFTLDQIKQRNDPANTILIMNMQGNKIERVVENYNSWKSTHALKDGDVVLNLEQWED